MAGVAGAEVGAAAGRTSVEAGGEEVAEERPSAVEAAVALVAAAWEVAAHFHAAETSGRAAAWEAAHSPAAETSGHASAASVVEAMTSHKVAGSMTVAGSGTVTETDFSSVFRSTATAITTMIMDTAVAAGCIEEQSIPVARIGGAATNSA